MALLAPQQIGVVGLKPTFAAATALGDTIKPQDGLILVVINGDASAKTVTLVRPGSQYGQANPDVARSIPAGERWYFKVPREFADTDGLIDITYSAVTSVTVALVRA
jgi:hypothetical protein